MTKKVFNKFIIFVPILIALIFLNSFNSFIKNPVDDSIYQNTSVADINSDVDSLDISVNRTNHTITYDLYFKTNDFDGVNVKSFFYQVDDEYTSPWLQIDFTDSKTTVEDNHVLKTFSYEQLFSVSSSDILTFDNYVRISIAYEKDGAFVNANTQPILLFLLEETNPISIDDSKTNLVINEDKTYAQIQFNFTNTSEYDLTQVNLVSKTNSNIEQTIFSDEDSYVLLQGDNNIPFQLLNEEEYSDLYLVLTFETIRGDSYILESVVNGDTNFTSGIVPEGSWSIWTLILLIIIIFLIILTILLLFIVIGQIIKRKRLEKQQDQAYYDENYEDGMY